jgi:hypothetical protein
MGTEIQEITLVALSDVAFARRTLQMLMTLKNSFLAGTHKIFVTCTNATDLCEEALPEISRVARQPWTLLQCSASTPPSSTVKINHSLLDEYTAPTGKVETSALDLYRRTGRLT